MGRGGVRTVRPGGPLPSASGQTPARPGEFAGFPTSARATAVPNLFFARLLPRIQAPEELLVTLYFFYAATVGGHHRRPPFVTRRELAADGTLATALANLSSDRDALDRGLALAVERGSLLRVEAKGDGREEALYLLATPYNRREAERLAGAELAIDEPLPEAEPEEEANVFALYEENIGAITPLIADDLKDAEERYPPRWLQEAFREAVSLNKRSWRYVSSILKRWEAEGPDYEEAGRDPEADWLERRYSRGKRPAGPR